MTVTLDTVVPTTTMEENNGKVTLCCTVCHTGTDKPHTLRDCLAAARELGAIDESVTGDIAKRVLFGTVAKRNQPLYVFGDECEWVIAYDFEDAKLVYAEHAGKQYLDQHFEGWGQETPETMIGCHCDVKTGKPATPGHGDTQFDIKTAEEWVAKLGRGYFCTTEYG